MWRLNVCPRLDHRELIACGHVYFICTHGEPRHSPFAGGPAPDPESWFWRGRLRKPRQVNRATIAASFEQRPSHELGTLVANQQQV
jgi:hypothetical protein